MVELRKLFAFAVNKLDSRNQTIFVFKSEVITALTYWSYLTVRVQAYGEQFSHKTESNKFSFVNYN